KALTQAALFQDGGREPLVVWPYRGLKILVAGYDVYPLVRMHRLPCRVVEKPFADRSQARSFRVKDLLRRNLSPLWVSYLRGLRCLEQALPAGGDRRSARALSEAAWREARQDQASDLG